MKASIRGIVGIATAASLILAGCSQAESAKTDPSESTAAATNAGPISVDSCGTTIELEKPAEKVIFQNAVGVAQLAELGLLDRASARSGDLEIGVYDTEAQKKLKEIPVLEGVDTGKSHIKVSTETFLEENPDLIIGFPSGMDVDKVRSSGLDVYIPRNYCPDNDSAQASFDDIYTDLDDYGTMFGVEDKVSEVTSELKQRVADLEKKAQENPEHKKKTVAVLWITPGDSEIYAYGSKSMAHVQAETIGLENVYADRPDRVSDVSVEDVLERNPDEIILLHGTGTPEEVTDTFLNLKGADSLKAVRENNYTTLSYALVDPPSPLSVQGLEDMYAQVFDEKAGS